MKRLISIILPVVLLVVLHITAVLALSDVNIFPCQFKPVVPDMEKLEWQDSMCDINYGFSVGSIQKLTPGAATARVGLIYVLPVIITAGIMYGLHRRTKRASRIMK